ncbi:MAG: OB-fold nucleic acid binding domain-containing protein, partial [Moraxellaceae bacterium]|nr:OB-fold nucleic acid binding domain-containing protein [Moraxellaceae bacterium]
ASAGQGGLFDAPGETSAIAPEYIDAKPWSEKIQLAEEKTAIGFFLSGHPFNTYKEEVRRFVRTPLSKVEPRREPQQVAGVVSGVRIKMGQRGKMAFVTLDDGSAPLDVTVYAEVLEANKNKIQADEVLIIEAKVSPDDFSGGLRVVADKVMSLGEARGRFARGLALRINGEVAKTGGPRKAADHLQGLLSAHAAPRDQGACPVRVRYRNGSAEGDLPLSERWTVRLDEPLLENLREWLSQDGVEIIYN